MIEFTKKLFCSIVQKVFGVNYAKVDIGGTEIDFETEWKQIDFISALEHRLNCVFPTCFESPETLTFLDSLCK